MRGSIHQFRVDNNLAYALQNVTKESTLDILSYFHGVAVYVVDDIMKKSKARWVNKDIVLFYKDSAIPFRMQIWGGDPKSSAFRARVDVLFPKTLEHVDVSNLMDQIAETGLGLTETIELPKFNRPNLKSPRCLSKVRKEQESERE